MFFSGIVTTTSSVPRTASATGAAVAPVSVVPQIVDAEVGNSEAFSEVRANDLDVLADTSEGAQQAVRVGRGHALARGHDHQHGVALGQHRLRSRNEGRKPDYASLQKPLPWINLSSCTLGKVLFDVDIFPL